MELLIVLVHAVRLSVIVHFVDHVGEVGRAVQIDGLQVSLVGVDHFLNPIDTWIKDVSIHGKTVARPLRVGRNCTTEAI